jgi:PAS domain S-box-containing protein
MSNPAGPNASRNPALQVANSDLASQQQAQNELAAAKRALEARERELNDRNHFLQSVTATSSDTLYLYHIQQGHHLYIDKQLMPLLGFASETIKSVGIQSWINGIHRDELPQALARLELQKTTADDVLPDFEFRLRNASKQWHWFKVRERIYQRDAAGKPEVLFGIMQDITSAKQAESTRRMLESQLRESQKMEAIGTLAGGIAHDFNNILAAILGNAMLAKEAGNDNATLQTCLAEIETAGKRARQLVRQILTFSRRETRTLSAQALQPLVHEALALLRVTLPAGIAIEVSLAEEPLFVRADPTQIQQVLMNLFTNAWHALVERQGRIQVRLDTAEHALDDRYGNAMTQRCARLSVTDNGQGMDTETKARIFEPFFTTKTGAQGTGLGLAVVHGIVLAHGGKIVVTSKASEGSTFEVFLPLTTDESSAVSAPQTPPAVHGQGERILYVDDDSALVFLVERLLQSQGYDVTGVKSSDDALHIIRNDPYAFDLVVTDYNMPGSSGLEVIKALSIMRPDLPVILTSGFVDESLRERALALGVRHIVHKPDTVEDLCQTIQSVLRTDQRRNDSIL